MKFYVKFKTIDFDPLKTKDPPGFEPTTLEFGCNLNKKNQYKSLPLVKLRPNPWVVGPAVARSLTNPKVRGSNPGRSFVF